MAADDEQNNKEVFFPVCWTQVDTMFDLASTAL